MPAYLDKPTPEGIQKLAKRLENTEQDALDNLMEELITMSKRDLTTPTFQGQTPNKSKAAQFGYGFVIWQENRQILTVDPGFKVPVPEDEKDLREKINEIIEPLLAGIWYRQTFHEPWWDEIVGDYVAFGRGWAFSSHVPEDWAGEEIKSTVEALNKATDADEIKEHKNKLAKLKQGTLPLRTRYVDPRGTRAVFDSKHWLPQVVESRKISRDAAEDEYGKDAIPEEFYGSGCSGTTEIELFHYANHRWCAVVLAGKESKFAEDPWQHGLNRQPYILLEADNIIRNKKGLRWVGILFHAKDPIDFLDQAFTDLAWLHHEWTLSPIIMRHDKEEYDEDARVEGRPPPSDYGPGKQIDIWNTEEIKRGEVPEISQQSIFLIMQVKEHINQTAMVPAAERGEIKSGTSNNAYQSQVAVAQRRARGILRGMARFVASWSAIQLRAICELTKDSDEKVSVFVGAKRGLVAAGYKEAELVTPEMIVAVIDQPIEVDEYTRWLIGQLKVDKFGFSPEQIIEEMGYANPEGVSKRGWDYRMDHGAEEADYEAMLQLSGQKYAQLDPAQEQEMGALYEGADPRMQAIVAQLSGSAQPSANGQAESNILRANAEQLPQNPTMPVAP